MAIGTPVKVVYNDALYAAAVAEGDGLVARLEDDMDKVMALSQVENEDKLGLLSEMPRMLGWARTFRNNLVTVIRPADEKPEEW